MQPGIDLNMFANMLRQKQQQQQSPVGQEMNQQRNSIDGQPDSMADSAMLDKQNKLAAILRMQGGGAKGQMVGDQFVPPSILQQLSPLMAMFAGGKK